MKLTPPNLSAVGDPTRRRACEAKWNEQVAALITAKRTPAGGQAAQQQSAPWVAAVLKAKVEVVDPNAERLADHMATMKEDNISAAATELAGSRLRDVIKAKAETSNRVLMAAMDDVQSQFVGGMKQLSTPNLAGSLSDDEISALCLTAVLAVRAVYDASYTVPTMIKELLMRVKPPQDKAAEQGSPRTSFGSGNLPPTADGDPMGWLRSLIMGAVQVGPLGEEELFFLLVHVSRYLDPFLDGEVPPNECLRRSEGFYYDRLRRDWEAEKGEGVEMRIPPELAYCQYLTHCVTKLNSNHGFGMHIPGLGRTPVGQQEQEDYLKRAVAAAIDSTERDFSPAQRVIGAMGNLRSDDLLPICRDHLTGLFLYHKELGDALAVANREGEEARRQERLRIWGYA